MYYKSKLNTPLGLIDIVSSESALVGLWTKSQKTELETISVDLNAENKNNNNLILINTQKWLMDYFNGLCPNIDTLSLEPIGTSFQQRVWEILLTIPYGDLRSYGDIARQISSERGMTHMSAQAVGNAVGKNPIAIIIPCHRVIGSNGSLGGYSSGIDKKIWLLEHEGVNVKNFLYQRM